MAAHPRLSNVWKILYAITFPITLPWDRTLCLSHSSRDCRILTTYMLHTIRYDLSSLSLTVLEISRAARQILLIFELRLSLSKSMEIISTHRTNIIFRFGLIIGHKSMERPYFDKSNRNVINVKVVR